MCYSFWWWCWGCQCRCRKRYSFSYECSKCDGENVGGDIGLGFHIDGDLCAHVSAKIDVGVWSIVGISVGVDGGIGFGVDEDEVEVVVVSSFSKISKELIKICLQIVLK